MNTTDEDRAIAEDFERGWSEERLNAARSGWGPGVIEVLPDNLAARLSAQAEAEGRRTLDLIIEAVENLLAASRRIKPLPTSPGK